jgi:hypothetical protein
MMPADQISERITKCSDVQWDTPGAMQAADRYDLAVLSGCVRATMDAAAPHVPGAVPLPASASGDPSTSRAHQGISLVLDGIDKRLSERRPG